MAITINCFGTFITNSLLQRFGSRLVAAAGVILLAVGCVFTSLMPKFLPIYFTYGLLVGVASSFILISSMNLILKYFPEKNASRATGIAIMGTTCGENMFCSQLCKSSCSCVCPCTSVRRSRNKH